VQYHRTRHKGIDHKFPQRAEAPDERSITERAIRNDTHHPARSRPTSQESLPRQWALPEDPISESTRGNVDEDPRRTGAGRSSQAARNSAAGQNPDTNRTIMRAIPYDERSGKQRGRTQQTASDRSGPKPLREARWSSAPIEARDHRGPAGLKGGDHHCATAGPHGRGAQNQGHEPS
jgi:hypothetical protein